MRIESFNAKALAEFSSTLFGVIAFSSAASAGVLLARPVLEPSIDTVIDPNIQPYFPPSIDSVYKIVKPACEDAEWFFRISCKSRTLSNPPQVSPESLSGRDV